MPIWRALSVVDRRHPLADTLGDLRREPRAARVSLDGLDEAGLVRRGGGEAAATLCERAGCVPTEVKNGHQLAEALLARDTPGDRVRARALADDALARAVALGLEPDARFARAVLERLT